MSVSDIITLLGLLLAIVAIVNEKHRNHLLLKMNAFDITMFIAAYLLIIYLVYFESFYDRSIYLNVLMVSKGLEPKTWAFVITNISILYLFYKIRWSFFAHRKADSVVKYYDSLMRKNEIDFLLDLLEKYHLEDIAGMLSGLPDVKVEYDIRTEYKRRFAKTTLTQKIKKGWKKVRVSVLCSIPISKTNREFYAYRILNEIIGMPEFIKLSANLRPYFFTPFIQHMTENRSRHFPEELVRSYYYELLTNNNFWLKKEIKDSQVSSHELPEATLDDNPIIAAAFRNLSVIEGGLVWKGFADAAFKELKEEIELKEKSYLFKRYEDESLLNEHTTYQTIQLFDLMIKEAIAKHYQHHMWLFYYSRFIELLVKYIKSTETPTYKANYHHLVESIITNMRDWIKFNNEVVESEIYLDIISCLGDIIQMVTAEERLGHEFIIAQLDRILDSYCGLRSDDDSNTADIRTNLERILLKPSNIGSLETYYPLFKLTWNKFDKYPHRTMAGLGEDYDYLKQLRDNVIRKLEFE